MKILIDGDPYAYRSCFSKDVESEDDAVEMVDSLLEETLMEVDPFWTDDDFELFLTGKTNFRHEVAVSFPYKGNRQQEKPDYLYEVRSHMIKDWAAVVSEGEEADDMIAIRATELYPDCVVVSIDKDMLQIPGSNYNPGSRKWAEISEFEGLKFFYQQILTGDKADNIIGLYGIGPKKSESMLEDCESEEAMYRVCLDAYGGDTDKVLENARLLWLRRYPGQFWEPPKTTDEAPHES